MTTPRPVTVVGVTIVLAAFGLTGIVSGRVPDDARSLAQPQSLPQAFARDGMTLPMAVDGRLVSFRRDLAAPSDRAIRVTSMASGKTQHLPFWVANASAVRIESVALTRTDEIVVAGEYTREPDGVAVLRAFIRQPGAQWAPDGKRLPGSTISNFLAAMSSSGKIRFMVDLADYSAQHVCAASDGTVWTVGQSWPLETRGSSAPGYAVVRRFSQEGRVVGRYVPRSSLSRASMVVNYQSMQPSAATAFIRCGERVTVVYLGRSPQGTALFEIDHGTGDVRSRVVRQSLPGMVTGFVLVSDDTLYASVGPRPAKRQNVAGVEGRRSVPTSLTEQRKQRQGVYRLELSSPAARWEFVRPHEKDARYVLLGTAGGKVVHLLREPGQQLRTSPRVFVNSFD